MCLGDVSTVAARYAMSVSVIMMAIGSQLSSSVVTTSAVSSARRIR
jgi:hypothetical protein